MGGEVRTLRGGSIGQGTKMDAQDIVNQKTAKDIIESIKYITIATVDGTGQPWNAPVFTAFDESYNFYWVSSPDSQHSKNIKENNKIFLVIYDSTSPEGRTENGVYLLTKAYEVEDREEIERAIKLYYGRKNKEPRKAEEFMGNPPRKIYKAVPEKVWLNVFNDVNGTLVDHRVEVTLTP